MFEEYEPVMSIQDVCDALMVGKNTVYNLIKSGKLNSFRIGKIWKISKNELVKFVCQEANLSYTINSDTHP